MELKLLHDAVIAKRLEPGEQTKSGLFLPTTARELPQLAEIIFCGRKVKDLKKGDVILIPKYWDHYIILDEVEYLWMKESDALAHLEEV